MTKKELEKRVMELETERVVLRVKADTVAALTDVTVLQASIIDHLYMVLSTVDKDMIDKHVLAQMKRAAEIREHYS